MFPLLSKAGVTLAVILVFLEVVDIRGAQSFNVTA
jgi:hypothetical protein